MNVTDNVATLSDLETGGTYHIFVVARNVHGTSLPSSIILITVNKTTEAKVKAVNSPPHSLAVISHSATWVTISWQPPEFSHPSEQITYRLYHKSKADEAFHVTNTSVTSHMIQNLNPNMQYYVYVTAISKKGQSQPSETLIVWTDPAYPAFVEVFTFKCCLKFLNKR